MFKIFKENNEQLQTDSSANNSVPSIVSKGVHIVGNIIMDGEIHIDGVVNGDIQSYKLTIGSEARITGYIDAEFAFIYGTVNGVIRAKSIFLSSTACVVGDIIHEEINIESGAKLEGHCHRLSLDTFSLRKKEQAAAENSFAYNLEKGKRDET